MRIGGLTDPMTSSIWTTLGIPATRDVTAIRRAYAARLKVTHPEDDPEGFQTLRAAYDAAMAYAGSGVSPRVSRASRARPGAPPVPKPPLPERADGSAVPPDAPVSPQALALADDLARARAEAQAHQALCDDLLKRLKDPGDDDQSALMGLIRIFRSPAMGSLQTHEQTEHWVAHLIGRGGPEVDPLIAPAIEFFDWDSSRVGVDLRHAAQVLNRRELAEAAARMRHPGSPFHRGYKALSRPQIPFSRYRAAVDFDLRRSVRLMLDQIDRHGMRALEAHMNPESLAWWRARLTTPHIAPLTIWLVTGVSVFWASIFAFSWLGGGGERGLGYLALTALTVWVAPTAIAIGVVFAYLHLVQWPRHRWHTRYDRWNEPVWRRLGWAALALGLLLVAGLLPGSVWMILPWSVSGLILLAWTRITAEPDRRPSNLHWRIRAGWSLAPIAVFWAFASAAIGPGAAPLTVALGAACLSAVLGGQTLADAWLDLPRKRRLWAAGGVAVLAMATLVLLIGTRVEPALLPIAAMAVAALSLADRTLSFQLGGTAAGVRTWGLAAGFVVSLGAADGLGSDYAASATVLIGGCLILALLISAGAALVPDRAR